ncbi:MAG: hypothetical protein KF680_05915 [Cryobacterium sp.]|nr:hypothetical protein [Cryobacterium sp.]
MNVVLERSRRVLGRARRLVGQARRRVRARRARSRHLSEVARRIRLRSASGERVRVGFFVLYDSAFPALPLARLLQEDPLFEPVIVLIPDVLRGRDNMFEQLNKSRESLRHLGIPVVSGIDEDSGSFNDVSETLDFVCISNPYDEITHEFFTMTYLLAKSVLPFYVSYTFGIVKFGRKTLSRDLFAGFWRVFAETPETAREYHKFSPAPRQAVEISGYVKMDELASFDRAEQVRRSVIIAPHHTVRAWEGGLQVSSFLSYADALLDLPRRYPEIDFIFRPHPLLFVHLKEADLWGPVKSAEYLAAMDAHPNARVDTTGRYLGTFAQSSALIHDSVSFAAEYLYTGNPALFLSTPETHPAEQFNELGALARSSTTTPRASINSTPSWKTS